MNWYYVEAGKQQGPVPEAELETLVMSGRIAPETLVWREGMPNWMPYSQAKPPAPASATDAPPVLAPAAGGIMCCECGKPFELDQVIKYGDRYVCATCKPVFLQRLSEGASLGTAGATMINEQQLLEREYRIDIGSALERAWKMFTANPGIIIATSLVIFLVAAACWLVSTLVGMVVPFANVLLSLVYPGPLVGGFLWFFIKLARNEPAGVGDAFAGFGPRFAQLLLSSLIQGLINLACMIPFGVVMAIMGVSMARSGGQPSAELGVAFVVVLIIGLLVSMAAIVYLNTLWTYSFLLVIDKRYNFWPAMQLSRKLVAKRWWMTFLFLFVAGLISGLGALACLVGLLVTVPLYYGMKVYLYEDNFRDLTPLP